MNAALGWNDWAMMLGLSITRIATVFLMLPLFNAEMIPALVRNSLFVGLAVIMLVLQPALPQLGKLDAMGWLLLFGKEVFIGLIMGFLVGGLIWAIEMAGHIIDFKAGITQASVIDPLSGHQSSMIGQLLSKLAIFVFMFSGGFMLLVGAIAESYSLWPIGEPLRGISPQSVTVIEGHFANFMWIGLAFAAPALAVLFVIDSALGLINRYAQQLNVFTLSPPLKTLAAILVILLMLGSLIDYMVSEFSTRSTLAIQVLKELILK